MQYPAVLADLVNIKSGTARKQQNSATELKK